MLSPPSHGFNVRRVRVSTGEVQWLEELRDSDGSIGLCSVEEGLFGFLNHQRNRAILLRA